MQKYSIKIKCKNILFRNIIIKIIKIIYFYNDYYFILVYHIVYNTYLIYII